VLADPSSPQWASSSIEFCGGTHCENTADAQAFVLTEEVAVSKGVRRIVALTGSYAAAANERGAKLTAAAQAAARAEGLEAMEEASAKLRDELKEVRGSTTHRRCESATLVMRKGRTSLRCGRQFDN